MEQEGTGFTRHPSRTGSHVHVPPIPGCSEHIDSLITLYYSIKLDPQCHPIEGRLLALVGLVTWKKHKPNKSRDPKTFQFFPNITVIR